MLGKSDLFVEMGEGGALKEPADSPAICLAGVRSSRRRRACCRSRIRTTQARALKAREILGFGEEGRELFQWILSFTFGEKGG